MERTEAMAGPNITAARPDPVGWLLLPVKDGSFSALTTKMKAPISASKGFASGFFLTILVSWYMPRAIIGIVIAHQISHHGCGRKPSIMCI